MSLSASFLSTSTAAVLLNTSARSGNVTLPYTQSTIGRVLTFKEKTGAIKAGSGTGGGGSTAAASNFSNSAPIRAISSLQLWLDAADSTSMMISSTRVLQWTDKSSNAYIFDSVTTNYPTVDSINGVQAVGVEGPAVGGANTQRFYNSAFTLTPTNYTIYTVAKQNPNAQGNLNYSLILCAANDIRLQYGAYNSTFATYTGNGTSWNDVNSNSPGYSVKNAFIGGMTVSSSVLLPYFNGSNQTQKIGTTASFTGLFVGDADNARPGYCWNGQIGEVLIFNQTLTPEDRRTVEGYLGWKWSLNTLLPASHIYRSVNPTTPITVSDISGLRLWLDATDNTKLSLSGSNVLSWTDKSSNAYVFNSVTTNYPTITTLNSKQAISMVGSSVRFSDTQRMYNGTFTLNNNNYTVFVAAKQNSGASSWTDVNYILGASPDFRLVFGARLGILATFTGSGSTWNDTAANIPNYSVTNAFLGGMTVNGSTLIPYYDGSNQNTKTGTTGSISGMFIGDTTAGFTGQCWNGQMGEIIIYDQTLSAYQRQIVESYLATKWGLTTTLPSTHTQVLSTITIPQQINSGLALWFDATDSSTYTLSGSNVSAWNSKTTYRQITVSQATASNRPFIASSVQNGLNVMRMSNANSATYVNLFNSAVASSNVANSNSFAVFFVHNPTMAGASPFGYQPSGSSPLRILTHLAYSDTHYFDWGNANQGSGRLTYSLGAGGGAAYIAEGFKLECFYVSEGYQRYRKNGTATASQSAITPTFDAAQIFTIGAINPTETTFYYRTDIGEFIWYKTALTQSQIELTEGYLAWKWGLSSKLPSNHPYKTTDPFAATGSDFISTFNILTTGIDTFENGASNLRLAQSFGQVSLLAGSDNKWYQLGGTHTYQATISSLLTSSIQGNGLLLTNIPHPTTLLSTVAGLGTAGYISSQSLISSVSSFTASAGGISRANLTSTVAGLGRAVYISSTQLASTVASINSNLSTIFIDTVERNSTITGLGNTLYVSTSRFNAQLSSTIAGLGTAGYVSTIPVNLNLSSLTISQMAYSGSLSTNRLSTNTVTTSSIAASNYLIYSSSTTSAVYFTSDGSNLLRNGVNYMSTYIKDVFMLSSLTTASGGSLIQTGLTASFDPGNVASYPGTGSTMTSLVGSVTARLTSTTTSAYNYSSSDGSIRLSNTSVTNETINTAVLQLNNSITFRTISMWMYIQPTYNISSHILDARPGTTDYIYGSAPFTSLFSGGTLYKNGGAAITPNFANSFTTGAWQHLTFVTSGSGTDNLTFFGNDITYSNMAGLNVSFGPIQVYSTALTQAENASNYNVFASRFVGGIASANSFLVNTNLASTITGMSTTVDGYITNTEMSSTIRGLGTAGYISTINPNLVLSSLNVANTANISTLATSSIVGSTITTSTLTSRDVKFFVSASTELAPAIVDSGLLLYLDGSNYSGSGTTWSNLATSGASYNATLFNTPTYSSSNGGYFSFLDTSAQYATAPNLGSQSRWTLETWTRTTASLTGKVTSIIANQYNDITSLNFSLGTNYNLTNYNLSVGYFDGAWRTLTGITPQLNTWVHYIGTYDGTTIKLYVNGALVDSFNYSGTPTSGGEVRIARRWDNIIATSNFYKGDIGVVRIYNRALTSNEVTSNYNAQSTRFLGGGGSADGTFSLTTNGQTLFLSGSNLASRYLANQFIPSTLSGNSFISSTQLTSTTLGLTTYASTFLDSSELASTVAGLGLAQYVSSLGLTTAFTSTVAGIGTAGYISSSQLQSTITGISTSVQVQNAEFASTIVQNYYNHSSITLQSSLVAYGPTYMSNTYYNQSSFVTVDALTSTMDSYFNQPVVYSPQNFSF